jgi:hypothetical protein
LNQFVGTPNVTIENDLAVKVINNSKVITNQQDVQMAAERYKTAIEGKFSTSTTVDLYPIFSILFKIKVSYKTKVILDYTPVNADGTYDAKLIFDDRVSTKTTATVNNPDGSTTTKTITNSTPGETIGYINHFKTSIGITMDGKEVSLDNDYDLTTEHEGGHSASLNHPWEVKHDQKAAIPEFDPSSQSYDPSILKRNLMNSAENPDDNTRSNDGSELLIKQLNYLYNKIKSTSMFKYQDLVPDTPTNSSTNSSQTNSYNTPSAN